MESLNNLDLVREYKIRVKELIPIKNEYSRLSMYTSRHQCNAVSGFYQPKASTKSQQTELLWATCRQQNVLAHSSTSKFYRITRFTYIVLIYWIKPLFEQNCVLFLNILPRWLLSKQVNFAIHQIPRHKLPAKFVYYVGQVTSFEEELEGRGFGEMLQICDKQCCAQNSVGVDCCE